VQALIAQNGNAYDEGLLDVFRLDVNEKAGF